MSVLERYGAFLPLTPSTPRITLGEGNTPLVRSQNLEREIAGVWVAGSSNTFGGSVEDDEVFAARMTIHGYPAANLASEGHNNLLHTMAMDLSAKRGEEVALPIDP